MSKSKTLIPTLFILVLFTACQSSPVQQSQAVTRFTSDVWLQNSDLTVDKTITAKGVVAFDGGLTMDTDKFTVADTTGQVIMLPVADSDAANYDSLVLIEHDMVGLGTKDRVYGLDIEMTRPAGYDTTNGDHDDAGLKIRMNNKSTANAIGTVLRGVDVNVKNDNPGGAITQIIGGSFTAQTDTSAGNTGTAYGLTARITANDAVTDSAIVGDFQYFRQAATVPTVEGVLSVRNSSTTGAGADFGLRISSDYSTTLTTDDMDYAVDMNDADVTVADIRQSNGNVIAATEGKVVYNTTQSITAAQLDAGKTVITVPAGLKVALVDAKAIPYGGSCATVTTVEISSTVKLVSYAQAQLAQNTVLYLNSTGVTVLADGASFSAQTAGQDITVGTTGAAVATCTGIKFVLTYTLEP